MIDPREIIAAYEKAEHLAGGLAEIDPKDVFKDVAGEFDIPPHEVEDIMRDHWAMVGGG